MSNVTENLYRALCTMPRAEVSAQGARLVYRIWSRLREAKRGGLPLAHPLPQGRLLARDCMNGMAAAETAAFNNAFRFAAECCAAGARTGGPLQQAYWAIPVFSASALAEARGANCESLSRAAGLGIEAYSRLVDSLDAPCAAKGFDARVIAATLAAIVACGEIENMEPGNVAQALGLGSSAVTAMSGGYLPVQAAMAAKDGIVMVLLVKSGFRGPPDPLACRWGIYDTFAGEKETNSLDLAARGTRARDRLRQVFGDSAPGEERLCNSDARLPVKEFVASLA